LNISPFVGHYNQKEDIEGAREIVQWIVDTLIRTDVNEGELLLKGLFIEDCIFYREEPHMLAHIPDKLADLLLSEFVGGLKVQTIKLTLDHESCF